MYSVLLSCMLYGIILVHCQITEYYYININKNWIDAQEYCRQYYTDLATFENIEDVYRITVPSDTFDWAWIGLFDDPASWLGAMTADSNSWKWSTTGTTSPGGYQNWANGEPNNYASAEWCVFAESAGWKDYFCTNWLKFICYTVDSSGNKEYFLIDTPMNWANAQSYCRQNYHDLALIETPSESQAVLDLVSDPPTSAWIGLSRQPYRWSDGNPSTYKRWASGEPRGDGYCASQRSDYYWNDVSCGLKKQFICQRVWKKAKVQTKLTLQTTANLADPAIKDTFLKLLEDHLRRSDSGFSLSWITPPKKEETKGNPVCATLY